MRSEKSGDLLLSKACSAIVEQLVGATRLTPALALGGMAMESPIDMTRELARGLSVWRPTACDEAEARREGVPFLRNRARQCGLT